MRSFLLVVLIVACSGPVLAQSPEGPPPDISLSAAPQCTAALEGQLSCQANRLCKCRLAPAVAARDLPARWAWDCSIKRPRCVVTPESVAPHPAITPNILAVERDDHADKDDRPGRRDDTERREPPRK